MPTAGTKSTKIRKSQRGEAATKRLAADADDWRFAPNDHNDHDAHDDHDDHDEEQP